jgi:hypothetical protein
VAKVYDLAADKICTYCLDTTYVLTPDGRRQARDQLLASFQSGEFGIDAGSDDPVVGLEFFDGPTDLGREEDDIACQGEGFLR